MTYKTVSGARSAEIELNGSVYTVNFGRSYKYYAVRNDGSETIYVSTTDKNCTPKNDGVVSIPSGGNYVHCNGFGGNFEIYLNGSGGATVIAQENGQNPFKSAAKGGDNNDIYKDNVLIYDDMGLPSVMVKIPKFYLDEVIDGAPHILHPAFVIDGAPQEEIYISKYQNIVENERGYSLFGKVPKTNITLLEASEYCRNKGAGWHLMTNSEWAAIALWCKKHGFIPKGNNNYGSDISGKNLFREAITGTTSEDGKTALTLTGTGDESWFHNNNFSGIADLNGNISEWVSGFQTDANGRVAIIPNNDAAFCDISETGNKWRYVHRYDGILNTQKDYGLCFYNSGNIYTSYLAVSWSANTMGSGKGGTFASVKTHTTEDGITTEGLKTMSYYGLYPHDTSDYNNDYVYIDHSKITAAYRGGDYSCGNKAGLWFVYSTKSQTDKADYVGFRSAYYGSI